MAAERRVGGGEEVRLSSEGTSNLLVRHHFFHATH
jgi:hypothetical protein